MGPCDGRLPQDALLADLRARYGFPTTAGTSFNTASVSARRTNLGAGLMHLASTTSRPNMDQWRLGLWSLNRPEWQIVSQAANAHSLIFCSLYETLGPDVVEYCINHAEVNVWFCLVQPQFLIPAPGRLLCSLAHPSAAGPRPQVPYPKGHCQHGKVSRS
jgi:hypothetical protein